MYQTVKDPNSGAVVGVLRITDDANLPIDPGNVDYQSYLAWVAAGNMPQAPQVQNA